MPWNLPKRTLISVCLLPLLASAQTSPPSQAATEKPATQKVSHTQVVDAALTRLKANQIAQQKLDGIYESSQSIVQDYESELQLLESLDIYNAMLQKQLDQQTQQMSQIRHSIANASLMERQVMPLLVRMLESLQELVALDVPFLLVERQSRVADLQNLMQRPDLTLAEKTRRVFEAYQIEMDYGSTIETYKGQVQHQGQQVAAEFLRIGRISLLYRDLNGERMGYWNKDSQQWQSLEESQYRRHLNKGIRIAKEEIAPELITIPVYQRLEARP